MADTTKTLVMKASIASGIAEEAGEKIADKLIADGYELVKNEPKVETAKSELKVQPAKK